jgi:hypothetical protein
LDKCVWPKFRLTVSAPRRSRWNNPISIFYLHIRQLSSIKRQLTPLSRGSSHEYEHIEQFDACQPPVYTHNRSNRHGYA